MTPIEKKYEEAGGINGFLGAPKTEEAATPNGMGSYREYQNGIIYYSPDYGACIMGAQVVEKWKSDTVAGYYTADGKNTVQDYLGLPVKDTEGTPRGEVCYFERGMIVCSGALFSSFVVYGSIYIIYRKHNDIHGWIGYPKTDEQPDPLGGRLSRFEQADIYWMRNIGAFELHGAIRERYAQMRANGSYIGYPISEESIIQKAGSEIGRSVNFQNGTLFWSSATGAFEINGELLISYINDFGGPAGVLGFPTSDWQLSYRNKFEFNNFQNGVLIFQPDTKKIRKVTNLKLVVTKLETDEDDDDLFVRSSASLIVNSREIKKIDKDFGEYSGTGTKTLTEQEGFIGNFPLRDGNAILSIFMKAWDVDSFLNFGDDEIASFTKKFDMETLWDASLPDMFGKSLLTWYDGPDGKFRAEFRIETDGFVISPSDSMHFRRDLFWHIHNQKIPELDFDTYAATFSDVEADDGWVFHPFNHIFYQAAYKKSAKSGTCFGMCLEAVYALKGRSASREPISQYIYDEQRKNNINVKFGYQLGGSQLGFMIKKFKEGEMWNPVHAFHLSRDLFNSGNYSIICLSKGFSFSEGHAVIPYRWDDSNPDEWRIYVANPNSPYNEQPDNNFRDAVIKINPHDNTSTYQHKANETWVSGAKGGGRMFVFPYSELSTEPRTPFWEVFLTLLTGGIYLVFAGDAQVEQVSDNRFGQYYDDRGNINTNAVTRIKNLMPIEPIGMPVDQLRMQLPGGIARLHDVVRLNKTASVFLLQHDHSPGKMYETEPERRLRNRLPRRLTTHILTAIGSNTFSRRLNPENATRHIDPHMLSHEYSNGDIISKALRNKSITVSLKGKQQGNYSCALVSGKSKIIISADAAPGETDQVTIDSISMPGQAVTFQADARATGRKIKISLISFNGMRMYEISNVVVTGGETITLQHNDACKELILHNSGNEILFNLDLYIDGEASPVLSKKNVSMGAQQVTHLEPVSWQEIKNRVPGAAIKQDVYDHLGGTLINSLQI